MTTICGHYTGPGRVGKLPRPRRAAGPILGAITLVGTLWFRVPFRGNPLVLLLGTSLYLLSTLALGLAISTVCKTQQQVFATNFFFVHPRFTLSGFSFPITSMPPVLNAIRDRASHHVAPARFSTLRLNPPDPSDRNRRNDC
jgi:ABC-type multidrug transport system permease subunit